MAFSRPVAVLEARRHEEVLPVLGELETAGRRGLAVAGFLTYEAAPGLDGALVTRPPGALPLAWFATFGEVREADLPPGGAWDAGPWTPSLSAEEHCRRLDRIRRAIAGGETYQVNLTFRMRAPFDGDPLGLFTELFRAQPTPHAAFVDLGRHALCSLSPELFFEQQGARLTVRPMKGTAPRGVDLEEDARRAAGLASSEKERAENVMVVDLLRNDLGRIARAGSVRVTRLFDVERYDTVFQMTSTVEAETAASLPAILAALFPSGSVTGAPKVRTMALIADLEDAPRGAYTGAIGYALPDGRRRFNVAIRTVHVDREAGIAEYGTGGGIVWDSRTGPEYTEALTKARILTARRPEFSLLETLRWEPGQGFFLLERHLGRLAASARYFDLAIDPSAVRARLAEAVAGLPPAVHRVRLVASEREISVEATLLEEDRRPWRVALARQPVRREDRFLYHKTTWRRTYEEALAAVPGADDVLLWNEAGELTEATRASLVVELDGRRWTPPVSCGLLPGTFRAELLARGEVAERQIRIADLPRLDRLWLVNSLRRWIPAELAPPPALRLTTTRASA